MGQIIVTQVKSKIGSCEKQKRTLEALGLHKLHKPRVHNDSPEVMGMVEVVKHLVKVEKK